MISQELRDKVDFIVKLQTEYRSLFQQRDVPGVIDQRKQLADDIEIKVIELFNSMIDKFPNPDGEDQDLIKAQVNKLYSDPDFFINKEINDSLIPLVIARFLVSVHKVQIRQWDGWTWFSNMYGKFILR